MTGLGIVLGGCASGRETPIRNFSSHHVPIDASIFRSYLLAAAGSQGTYLCKSSGSDGPTSYVRRQIPGGRVEGVLADSDPLPLDRYLDPDSTRRNREPFPWAKMGTRTYGYFALFNPPVAEFPEASTSDVPGILWSRLTVFDARGIPFAIGVSTRAVEFDGFQMVRAAGREFPNCARIRVETDFSFGWWCKVRVLETLLVDREFGIVKKDERLSGDAMIIFSFSSFSNCNLEESANEPMKKITELPEIPRWTGLAIQMDRIFHQPVIRGLVAQFASFNSSSTPGSPIASE